ncbi:DUF4041 domain-containing protein [Blastococcus sp. SYSU D00669]
MTGDMVVDSTGVSMAQRFQTPPTWPTPPEGWVPPAGWQPDPAWGPAPAGWQFWTSDGSATTAPAAPTAPPTAAVPQTAAAPPLPAEGEEKVSIFRARGRVRELTAEVAALRDQLARLGALTVADLEAQAEALREQLAQLQAELHAERDQHAATLAQQAADARRRTEQELEQLTRQRDKTQGQLAQLRHEVVVTQEEALLQEVGVYTYRHPLSEAMAYQAELAALQAQIKAMTKKDGGAVTASTNWTVNGSLAQGRTMVRDFSKLLLRAYNAEADNLVRGLKPYKLDAAIERLTKVATTIMRLGKTMDIRISDAYHRLRIRELELTADYVAKVAEEKEREREEKARLREERAAQQEMEREKARLEKERQHYLNARQALLDKGDPDGAARLQEKLDEIGRAIEDVDYRAANIRAGYVYVISNIGAFGAEMVKVGMTRRLDPLDRVRELGDASVPFRYDVHALFFSDDAVGIETALHQRLADKRVNVVNPRREFFHATAAEVKTLLAELAGDLLHFEDFPEALEYRQSLAARTHTGQARTA